MRSVYEIGGVKMTQPPNFDDDDDTGGAVRLQTVFEWIRADDNIKKTHPIKKTESATFHISIKKHIIEISAANLMAGQGKFNTMCFGELGVQVKHNKKKWPEFIQYISDASVDIGLQDTTAGMDADHLLEIIMEEMTITDDIKHLECRGNALQMVKYTSAGEMWFVVPSSKIREIVSAESIKTSTADLSAAMDAKKYKRPGVHTVRFSPAKNDVVRGWFFYPDVINGGIYDVVV